MKRDTKYKMATALVVVALFASSIGLMAVLDDTEDVEAEPQMYGSSWGNILKKPLIWLGDMYWGTSAILYAMAGVQGPPRLADMDDDIKATFAQTVMEYTATDLSTLAGTAGMLIDNNRQTWTLAQSYVSRAAEISAGMNWSAGGVYDPETILALAGVYALAGNSVYNTDYALHEAMSKMADRTAYWDTQGSPYDSITEGITWDGGDSGMTADSAMMYFTSIVSADQTANRVYFADDGNGEYVASIYALTNSGKLTGKDGAEYPLEKGVNTFTDGNRPPVGWYTISSGVYAGAFMHSVAPEGKAANVVGGAVLDVGGTRGYVTINSDQSLNVNWNGAQYQSQTLKYKYAYGSGTATTSGTPDSIAALLRYYAAQTATINNVLANAAQAGQVMWTICGSAGQANILLSPSSISPQLTNVGISANQSYALYVSALSQISDYWKSNGTQLSAAQTKISAESLELYCRGTLYNSDGTAIMDNVIFTPYTYVRDMTVYANGYSTTTYIDQDGMCAVWSAENAYADIADFNQSSPSSQTAVLMPAGTYFVADQMMYKGQATSDITLHVKEITKVTSVKDIVTPATTVPKVLDADTLVMIMLFELAALFLVLGLWTKQAFFFVAAIIIAVVGVIAPGWIAQILIELFGS